MTEQRFIQNIIDQIKEAQLKLGYAKETIRLYFPVPSLNVLLGTDRTTAQEMLAQLQADTRMEETCLGKLQFAVHEGQIQVSIPPEGVEYVYEKVPAPAFLEEFIRLFQTGQHSTLEDIRAVFQKYGPHVCRKMPEGSDFDYVLYFNDPAVDGYYYCIKMEMGHTVYHRFLREDYLQLVGGPKLDVLILGSGPAGLSAAVYAIRANLSVLVAEKDYLGTGQIVESDQVDNYLGMPGINGYDLGEAFREHAVKLGVEFFEGEADAFVPIEDGWSVHFQDGQVIEAKTVIYCAGAAHRSLGVDGETEFVGKGVSYCAVCDGAFYRGKEAAVIGGGDTALGDALYLSELCDKVYLVHRREQFRGSAQTVRQLQEKDNVEILTNAVPAKIMGEDTVTALELKDGRSIPVNGAFIAVGMQPRTQHLKDVVELDGSGYVIADETGVTTAPGFFVAGDVRAKALRQVVTAVSDGANAATAAAEYIMQKV